MGLHAVEHAAQYLPPQMAIGGEAGVVATDTKELKPRTNEACGGAEAVGSQTCGGTVLAPLPPTFWSQPFPPSVAVLL